MMKFWQKAEAWLLDNAENIYEQLEGPCDPAILGEIENAAGRVLPQSFKDFYLTHNGFEMLMEDFCKVEEISAEVKARRFGELIPFSRLGHEDIFFLNSDGKVIYYDMAVGIENFEVAGSFKDWTDQLINALESGIYQLEVDIRTGVEYLCQKDGEQRWFLTGDILNSPKDSTL